MYVMLLLQVHVCISESTVVNLLLCCSSLSTKRSYMQKIMFRIDFLQAFLTCPAVGFNKLKHYE